MITESLDTKQSEQVVRFQSRDYSTRRHEGWETVISIPGTRGGGFKIDTREWESKTGLGYYVETKRIHHVLLGADENPVEILETSGSYTPYPGTSWTEEWNGFAVLGPLTEQQARAVEVRDVWVSHD